MKASDYIVGEFINAEFVKHQEDDKRTGVIIGKPTSQEFENERDVNGTKQKVKTEKLVIPIEINGKQKKYVPNKNATRSLIDSLGDETDNWVGSKLTFSTAIVSGSAPAVVVTATKKKK
jgi:hypothetical protein